MEKKSELSAAPTSYESIASAVQILEAVVYASIGIYIIKSSRWCEISPGMKSKKKVWGMCFINISIRKQSFLAVRRC